MTRTALYALAGLAGSLYAQQVTVTVSLGDNANNLEYKTEQTFKCSWTGDDALNNANVDLNNEALRIKWYYKGDTIYTMEAEEYQAYPSFGSAFFEREQITVTANVTQGFSSLTLGSVSLKDVGDYKCRVSLKDPKEINGKKAYVSGNGEMKGVKVYARPSVSFSDLALSHDIRDQQYDAFKATLPVELPATNSTGNATAVVSESDGSISSEITESSVSVETAEADSESAESVQVDTEAVPVESSRKRRQAAETPAAVPELQTTTISNNLASCVINGAFPEPSNIAVYIGNDKINDLDGSQFNVNQNGELFDAKVSVSAAINGPEQNGQPIKCVVNDAEQMYQVETSSDALDIKYLTTEVLVKSSNENVFEDEELTVSCSANGNPAPSLTLVHLNSDSINAQINGNSTYTISKVVRTGDYAFKCVARSSEPGYELFVKESEQLTVQVKYLTTPVIDVEGERTEVKNKFTVAQDKQFTLSCEAEADPVATYLWYKGSENIGESNAYKVEKADWSDSGDYYCQASNGETSIKKSRTINIEVQGQCVVKKISTVAGKIGKDGKQSATLTCEIDEAVQPACKIQWIFQKEVFKTTKKGDQLILNNVNEIDSSKLLESVVTCQASNDFTTYKPARVLKGTDIAKLIDSQDSGFPWMYVGIGALVLVVIIIVIKKRKSNQAPAEESEKMNSATV